MGKIGIIIGSVRPNRFGPQIANWVYGLATDHGGAEFELVDIANYNLPLLDEPELPAMGDYQNEHTKKWAAKIAEFDGYIFVTPEYNHSLPGGLKNALDFLFSEWRYKPVSYVSYGAVGGSRAVEQLRTVAAQFSQYDLRAQVLIVGPRNYLDENGKFQASEEHIASAKEVAEEAVFWAEALKPIRKKLTA